MARMASTAVPTLPRRRASASVASSSCEVEAPPAFGGNRVGQPLRDGDVCGAVIERTLEQPPLGEDERKLRIDVGRAVREGGEQRAERRGAAVEDEADVAVGEQARGVRPVARRLRMADRLDRRAVLLVPAGRCLVQRRDHRRGGPPQLESQQLREEVVVAKHGPSGIQRDDERVRVLELLQDPLRARAAGEEVGHRSAHLLQKGCAQQELAHLRGLALEHLGHEIRRHRPLAPGELAHEALRIGVLRERECRQPQPGHPALGPFVQQRHGVVVERDAVRLQQLARLVEREAQVGRADLGQPVGQAQAMQTQPRILACRQRHTQPRREFAQEVLEQAQRVGGPELMEVVDDQDERLVERAQVGQQALDDGIAAERRGGAHAFDEPLSADRIGHRIDHRQPEVLRVLFVALDRDPRDAAAKAFGPGSQEDRLPAAGRRADEQHAPWTAGGQRTEQGAAGNQPARGR